MAAATPEKPRSAKPSIAEGAQTAPVLISPVAVGPVSVFDWPPRARTSTLGSFGSGTGYARRYHLPVCRMVLAVGLLLVGLFLCIVGGILQHLILGCTGLLCFLPGAYATGAYIAIWRGYGVYCKKEEWWAPDDELEDA